MTTFTEVESRIREDYPGDSLALTIFQTICQRPVTEEFQPGVFRYYVASTGRNMRDMVDAVNYLASERAGFLEEVYRDGVEQLHPRMVCEILESGKTPSGEALTDWCQRVEITYRVIARHG